MTTVMHKLKATNYHAAHRNNPRANARVHIEAEHARLLAQHPASQPILWACDQCPGDSRWPTINSAVNVDGTHPLGYLVCEACNKPASRSAREEAFGSEDTAGSSTNDTPMDVCHVCDRCGLSWQADLSKVTCVCGAGDGLLRRKWKPMAHGLHSGGSSEPAGPETQAEDFFGQATEDRSGQAAENLSDDSAEEPFYDAPEEFFDDAPEEPWGDTAEDAFSDAAEAEAARQIGVFGFVYV